jgi:uncharacterized NAD-dependent epimerase/dehydratase family protein
MPHGMILCYEAGRTHVRGMDGIPLTSLAKLQELYESLAAVMLPSRVIGVGLNSRLLDAEQTARERERVRAELGVPVCDALRDGPDELVDAVLALKTSLA